MMRYTNHSQVRSAVNSSPIAPTLSNQSLSNQSQPKRIKNRVYRQCAKDGFNARLQAELAGEMPTVPRLYSHHKTRQSYFNKGWHAVTAMHILQAKQRQQTQSPMRDHLGAFKEGEVQ